MSRTTGGVVAVAAAALALPLVLPGPYHRHVLVLAGLFTLMALGFDLVLGYLGELSLGHAAFFGIGAYTTALLTRNFGVPFPLDLLLAGLFTGIFGLLIGVAILVTRRLLASTVGQAFLAIRENEELASATGIPTFRFKVLAFVVGMSITGAAGSVYARYVHFVDPTALSFYYTVTVVSMVIVGGQGSIAGTILGALLFTLLPEYLRVAERARLVIFGAFLMVAIVFMPEGLRGLWRRARPRRSLGAAA